MASVFGKIISPYSPESQSSPQKTGLGSRVATSGGAQTQPQSRPIVGPGVAPPPSVVTPPRPIVGPGGTNSPSIIQPFQPSQRMQSQPSPVAKMSLGGMGSQPVVRGVSSPDEANKKRARQAEIKKKIEELKGVQNSQAFYSDVMENGYTASDGKYYNSPDDMLREIPILSSELSSLDKELYEYDNATSVSTDYGDSDSPPIPAPGPGYDNNQGEVVDEAEMYRRTRAAKQAKIDEIKRQMGGLLEAINQGKFLSGNPNQAPTDWRGNSGISIGPEVIQAKYDELANLLKQLEAELGGMTEPGYKPPPPPGQGQEDAELALPPEIPAAPPGGGDSPGNTIDDFKPGEEDASVPPAAIPQVEVKDDTSAFESSLNSRLDALNSLRNTFQQLGGEKTTQRQALADAIRRQEAQARSHAASRVGMNRGLASKLLTKQLAGVRTAGNQSLRLQQLQDQHSAAGDLIKQINAIQGLDKGVYDTFQNATKEKLKSAYQDKLSAMQDEWNKLIKQKEADYRMQAALAGQPDKPSTMETILDIGGKVVPIISNLAGLF